MAVLLLVKIGVKYISEEWPFRSRPDNTHLTFSTLISCGSSSMCVFLRNLPN